MTRILRKLPACRALQKAVQYATVEDGAEQEHSPQVVGSYDSIQKEAAPYMGGTLPQVGVTGLEPVDTSCVQASNLCHAAPSSAAKSGAVGTDSPPVDPELRVVIDAWPALTEAVRAEVFAMIRATT